MPTTSCNGASRTKAKPAVTATALHIQAERGLIDYDATVATYCHALEQRA